MNRFKVANKEFRFQRATKNADSVSCTGNRHYHDLFEIYYLESGTCQYFIDNKSYVLLPGDLAIIPAGVIHNTNYQQARYTRLLLNFSTKYIPALILPELKKMGFLYRNQGVSDQIKEMFQLIQTEYERGDLYSDESIRCYMNLFFFLLIRNPNCYDDKRTRKEYVEKAIEYVQANFCDPELSLSAVAKIFSVSSEHFSREFKKETGFGFCEYVNLLRIKKSEILIKNKTGDSIMEISHQCGFNDSNYFSAKFKKTYGVSPKQMQKTFCQKNQKKLQTGKEITKKDIAPSDVPW